MGVGGGTGCSTTSVQWPCDPIKSTMFHTTKPVGRLRN